MDPFRFLRGAFGITANLTKQEIPEVAAVYEALEPAVRRDQERSSEAAFELLLALLFAYEERTGSEDVAAIQRPGRERKIEQEILAILAALSERLERPFPSRLATAVQSAGTELLQEGSLALGNVLRLDSPRAVATSRRDLLLLLRGHFQRHADDLRDPIRGYLTNASLRQALRSGAPSAAEREVVARWRSEARSALGLPWSEWGPQTVDAWAYRWHNVGRFLGGEQAGVLRWVAQNPNDDRTTRFCRWVNGKVVGTTRIRQLLDDYFQSVSEGRIESMARAWPLQEPRGSRVDFRAALSRRGLPPYHFRCRTIVVPA